MDAPDDHTLLDALRDALDDGPQAAYESALRERGDRSDIWVQSTGKRFSRRVNGSVDG